MQDLPKISTTAFIGIMIAITGNVLISLALNLQKLAHKRVDAARTARLGQDGSHRNGHKYYNGAVRNNPSLDERDESDSESPPQSQALGHSAATRDERQPLVQPSRYGAVEGRTPHSSSVARSKRTLISRFIPLRFQAKPTVMEQGANALLPIDVMSEEAALNVVRNPHKEPEHITHNSEENEADYLKSKLWWLGFLLMNLGELGNFISYAYAPASVVAPLGTFALVANCIFAPLLLKEQFRKRDVLGILIAIIGAVTVVLSTNSTDTRLDPDALIRAISQLPFIVYSAIYVGGVIVLSALSQTTIGRTWVFIDVGLCALFGGFTVLSTKALSTLLTMEWIEIFTKWITYPILMVLILTGIGQIRYLNRALMRFDSKVVIPIQFVLFTLSAIVGSAILYGDFKKAKFHQVVTFLYGCAATFAGVFIIAWAPHGSQQLEEVEPLDAARAPGNTEGRQLGLGSIGRRRHATLVLPSGMTGATEVRDTPSLRRKRSTLSLIGISPAQHLLLVHTPPRDIPPFHFPSDDINMQLDLWSRPMGDVEC
ncbi:magnesium transporter NIPA-domain-containing protein [Cyathus striatus]|nr:magnesium transporter NIPA-domain-containing protein [Cyathus striatus]